MPNQEIQCNVQTCKFNENAQQKCSLHAISVGKKEQQARSKTATECDSFIVKP